MAVEEFGRTHSITGGREQEEAAEQRYAAVREPIWRRASTTDAPRVAQRGEETLIRSRPGYGRYGVGNLFEVAAGRYVHDSSPALRAARRLWDEQALVFGEEFPDRLAGAADPLATVSADPDPVVPMPDGTGPDAVVIEFGAP
jgi:hypothetical protein